VPPKNSWDWQIGNEYSKSSMVQALTLTQCFSCRFYEVAKGGIIGRFSHIWLQPKYESKNKMKSLYDFGNLLEQCIKIWHFFLKFWSNYGY
jgi:hypothetical protein